MSDDLVLVREVQARRVLRERRLKMQMLVPYGKWTGCGALRVLRLRSNGDEVELTVGYESYRP